MNWLEVTIHTTTSGIEPVTALLLSYGIEGLIVEDDASVSRILEETKDSWDYVDEGLVKAPAHDTKIKFYFPADAADTAEKALAISKALQDLKKWDTADAWGDLTAVELKRDDQQWIYRWKDYFTPFVVGEKLYVVPAWEESKAPGHRVPLLVDTNMSFGTGQHSTTRLCLELLEQMVKPGMKVLDMGCGSGILGVGALLLGASHVTAVDIEEDACQTTAKNMALNQISTEQFCVKCGNILENQDLLLSLGAGFDLVCANIVADVICAMAPVFFRLLKPEGILLASGIIDTRGAEVAKVLEDSGFEVVERNLAAGWLSFGCRRHS